MEVSRQQHTPAALPLVKRLGTHWTEDWVGPRASLDGGGKTGPHLGLSCTVQILHYLAVYTSFFCPAATLSPAYVY
jgi:hypothetical protein